MEYDKILSKDKWQENTLMETFNDFVIVIVV